VVVEDTAVVDLSLSLLLFLAHDITQLCQMTSSNPDPTPVQRAEGQQPQTTIQRLFRLADAGLPTLPTQTTS
jgi:hypothetical protein